MKKQRQLLAMILAASMLAVCVTGCGGKEDPAPEETPAEVSEETPEESAGEEAEVPEETSDETAAPAEKKGLLLTRRPTKSEVKKVLLLNC